LGKEYDDDELERLISEEDDEISARIDELAEERGVDKDDYDEICPIIDEVIDERYK